MRSVFVSLLGTLRTSFCERAVLQLEILALRHQLQVLERTRWPRTRHNPGRSHHHPLGQSSPVQKSAACTIAIGTTAEPRSHNPVL